MQKINMSFILLTFYVLAVSPAVSKRRLTVVVPRQIVVRYRNYFINDVACLAKIYAKGPLTMKHIIVETTELENIEE